jgi:hypothetical protein
VIVLSVPYSPSRSGVFIKELMLYELMAKELSVALGFSKKCLLDPNALIKDHQLIAQPGRMIFLKSLLAAKTVECQSIILRLDS